MSYRKCSRIVVNRSSVICSYSLSCLVGLISVFLSRFGNTLIELPLRWILTSNHSNQFLKILNISYMSNRTLKIKMTANQCTNCGMATPTMESFKEQIQNNNKYKELFFVHSVILYLKHYTGIKTTKIFRIT
jgi:hypothetical protein